MQKSRVLRRRGSMLGLLLGGGSAAASGLIGLVGLGCQWAWGASGLGVPVGRGASGLGVPVGLGCQRIRLERFTRILYGPFIDFGRFGTCEPLQRTSFDGRVCGLGRLLDWAERITR
jgi:hypothetical protein